MVTQIAYFFFLIFSTLAVALSPVNPATIIFVGLAYYCYQAIVKTEGTRANKFIRVFANILFGISAFTMGATICFIGIDIFATDLAKKSGSGGYFDAVFTMLVLSVLGWHFQEIANTRSKAQGISLKPSRVIKNVLTWVFIGFIIPLSLYIFVAPKQSNTTSVPQTLPTENVSPNNEFKVDSVDNMSSSVVEEVAVPASEAEPEIAQKIELEPAQQEDSVQNLPVQNEQPKTVDAIQNEQSVASNKQETSATKPLVKEKSVEQPSSSKSEKTTARDLDVNLLKASNVTFQRDGDTAIISWNVSNKSGVTLGKQQFKMVFYDGVNLSGSILGEDTSKEFDKLLGPCGTLPYKARVQMPSNTRSISIQTLMVKPFIANQTEPIQVCD